MKRIFFSILLMGFILSAYGQLADSIIIEVRLNDNDWSKTQKIYYTYNANDQITEEILYTWSHQDFWKHSTKKIKEYNSNNLIIKELSMRSQSQTQVADWQLTSLIEYFRNEQGRITRYVSQSYDNNVLTNHQISERTLQDSLVIESILLWGQNGATPTN